MKVLIVEPSPIPILVPLGPKYSPQDHVFKGEKRTLLNNILRRKANSIDHILIKNCLLHDDLEGQMTEVKGVERRRTQLLCDFRNRRYWKLKEEAEDRKRWRGQLINRT